MFVKVTPLLVLLDVVTSFIFNFLASILLVVVTSCQALVTIAKFLFTDTPFCIFFCRYVDMIANPEVADVFRKRAKVILSFYALFLRSLHTFLIPPGEVLIFIFFK